MSLVHDILATLPQLRTEAEGRMVDECTVTRAGGEETYNPATNAYTAAAGSTVYTGACEVQISDGLNARQAEAGGAELTISRLTVKIPISVEDVTIGDIVTITDTLLDPDLIGQRFRVIAGHAKTFATARRLQVERAS